MADSDPPKLRRALSLPLLTLYGLGVTLGAGIYVLVGAAADTAGIYAPIAFLVAALVVSITALSYSELATRMPVSAGEAAYVEAGIGVRQVTLLVGLLVALSGIVSSSAVAIGAGAYLSNLTGLPPPVLVFATVLAVGALAAWGITESVSAAAIITVIEVAGLIFVIYFGFSDNSDQVLTIGEIIPPVTGQHWLGIGAATILAFFAFIGFEDMANVAEEVREPVKTFPRAVILTLLITTALYALTTVAVVTTVPIEDLAGSSAPLILTFKDAPAYVADAFGVIAVVATVNGILIQIIMSSRVVFGLSDRGYLPQWLSVVNERTRTPIAATALVVVAVLLLSQAFPIEQLAEKTSQIVLVIFVLVNVSLIRVKRGRVAAPERHFSVPIFVPILGAVTCAALFLAGMF